MSPFPKHGKKEFVTPNVLPIAFSFFRFPVVEIVPRFFQCGLTGNRPLVILFSLELRKKNTFFSFFFFFLFREAGGRPTVVGPKIDDGFALKNKSALKLTIFSIIKIRGEGGLNFSLNSSPIN